MPLNCIYKLVSTRARTHTHTQTKENKQMLRNRERERGYYEQFFFAF